MWTVFGSLWFSLCILVSIYLWHDLFDTIFTGYLITCVNDIKLVFTRISSAKETIHGYSADSKRLLVSLMEPAIEFIMKCIFNDVSLVSNGISCGNNTFLKAFACLGLLSFSSINCFKFIVIVTIS